MCRSAGNIISCCTITRIPLFLVETDPEDNRLWWKIVLSLISKYIIYIIFCADLLCCHLMKVKVTLKKIKSHYFYGFSSYWLFTKKHPYFSPLPFDPSVHLLKSSFSRPFIYSIRRLFYLSVFSRHLLLLSLFLLFPPVSFTPFIICSTSYPISHLLHLLLVPFSTLLFAPIVFVFVVIYCICHFLRLSIGPSLI